MYVLEEKHVFWHLAASENSEVPPSRTPVLSNLADSGDLPVCAPGRHRQTANGTRARNSTQKRPESFIYTVYNFFYLLFIFDSSGNSKRRKFLRFTVSSILLIKMGHPDHQTL